MPDVIVVGDGPAGLSAALFLAKNDLSVTVFGKDETFMHKALLLNYLGIPRIEGGKFQEIARKQVRDFGGQVEDIEVAAATRTEEGFSVETADGARHECRYLILATGPKTPLAEGLGIGKDKGGLQTDRNGRTPVDGLYVAGWSTRTRKIQAIISAGDGAATALDILSAEAGEEIHDFDVIESDE